MIVLTQLSAPAHVADHDDRIIATTLITRLNVNISLWLNDSDNNRCYLIDFLVIFFRSRSIAWIETCFWSTYADPASMSVVTF